jgi:hypothetical protein
VLTFDGARTYTPEVISTHGFEFVSDGHCCAYSWGVGGGNADNGTQRMIYTLYDLTMTAMDDSAFTVTSLDFGTSSLAPPASRYSVLLTGTARMARLSRARWMSGIPSRPTRSPTSAISSRSCSRIRQARRST